MAGLLSDCSRGFAKEIELCSFNIDFHKVDARLNRSDSAARTTSAEHFPH